MAKVNLYTRISDLQQKHIILLSTTVEIEFTFQYRQRSSFLSQSRIEHSVPVYRRQNK